MCTTLTDVPVGSQVRIEHVPENTLRAKLQRLGFLDGPVRCQQRLRKGPVILNRHGTDIALGRSIAVDLEVTEVEEA
ncbi:MAG: ferrous iron transport protein A [Halodesulfurarchaeum sp.]